ncbi:Sugar transporter [Balamuthia mandrillaris]
MMPALATVISWLCTPLTVGLYYSPMSTVEKVKHEGSTGGRPALPFVSMLVNCLLWGHYGFLLWNYTLLVTNGIGAGFALYYLSVFWKVMQGQEKASMQKQLAIAFGFLACVLLFVTFISPDGRLHLGMIASAVTVFMFASPLSTMVTVIATKSTDTLSFPLSFMTVVVTTLWAMYGFLLGDSFILLSNSLGLFLGAIQLSLFLVYPQKTLPVTSHPQSV